VKVRTTRADGSKTFFWKPAGENTSLYAVDHLGDAPVVYLCEGEKGADFLRALGHAAVATGGANRLNLDFTPLAGRHILMIVDRDDAGHAWARACETKLAPIATSVNAMQSKVDIPHADVVEHISGGYELSELVPFILQADDDDEEPPPAPQGREIKWMLGSQVETAVPVWAWEFRGKGRIQLGTMALLAGRPGAGKSSAARWLAAEASFGRLEGQWYGKPQNVAYIAAEESLKYTIGPGLRAAGADMSRIHFPSAYNAGEPTQILSTLDEIRLIEYMIANNITIVVVDPLMSTVTATTDINRNNEVRGQITPWSRMADEINGIVLGVVHLRKGSTNGDVVAAINGSSAFGELARSIFAFAKAGDTEERVMSQHKNSTGSEDLALLYEITGKEIMADDGQVASVGIFNPLGDSEFTVEDIMSDGIQTSGVGVECKRWLEDFLSVEGPISSRDVKREAKKVGDWGHSAVERAAKKLRVLSTSEGFPRMTIWALPVGPVTSQSPH
jgi:hypothetical protein